MKDQFAETFHIFPEVPRLALLHLALRIVLQPQKQRFILRQIQTDQQIVNGIDQRRVFLHLYFITALQTNFATKGADRLLEEMVDGADVKGRIIIQNDR